MSKFFSSLTLLLFTLTATTHSLLGQTLIGPSQLLANTEATYSISDASVTGNWEVNGSATVSTNLVNQNAIKVKANNLCVGRFTVIVKIGDQYLYRQVDIIKNLPPIFTSGATTATLDCNSNLEDFNQYKPTAKDTDGNAVEVVIKSMVPMQMGRCLSIVTWEATDRCGNKATFVQTIEVIGNDTQAPVFDPTTLEKTFYDCDKIPATFPTPKATDNCINPVMVKLVRREISERIRSSINCMSYFEILTWEATDVCGNKSTADQTICIVDNVPPVFVSSTLAPITVFQCGFDYDKYQPKATDNCSNPVMIMAVDIQTTIIDATRRTVVITWEATDMCGNATRARQTFNVIDQTPPRINRGLPLPALALECSDDLNNIQIPSGFDDCGDPVEVILSSTRIIVAGNCGGIIEITWKATDASGNMSFAKQIININDKTPPVLVCPAGMTVSCASQVPAPNIAAVVATDNCDDDVAVAFVDDVISNQTCANRYTITRTFRGTDDCGNATTCSQIITVNDRTVPVITCPGAMNVSCASEVPAPNIALVTATDNCGGNVAIDFVNDVISNRTCANRYTITRTYRATDACGNTATCTQTITVNDQTPPMITCPGTITVSCFSLVPAPNTTLPTATDNCGGNVVISHVGDAAVGGQCANRFRITRTYMATDLCGNTATCTQTIIVDDQIPPMITCPGTITVSCANLVPAPNPASVVATDNCGGNVVVTHVGDAAVGGQCANRFRITRTYMATDICGNTATCTQTIIVDDQTAPTFTFCPPGANLGCNPRIIPAPGNATATDNCGAVTITDALGNITTNGCNRSQTRTYTATDACGNTATCTQVFTWTVDVTPPVFTFCPPGGNLGCNPTGVPAPGAATATDDCGAPVITSALGTITSDGCLRSQTRTYTATDVCGNTATCTQVFTWTVDAVPPVFTFCPPGSNLGCNPTGVPAPGAATATDNCGAPAITSALGTVVVNGCSRSQTRTYTATDACGNTATCTQVFTWTVDVTGPTFTFCPPGSNLGCNPNGVPAPGAATATDVCGGNVTITSALGNITTNGCSRSQTRTYTATDACGNTSTCAQVFTWTMDNGMPTFTFCPPGGNLGCNPTGVPAPGAATATDDCGAPVITSALGAITTNGCLRSQTRTYTATDVCGNTATCTQVFTWTVDAVPPVFTFCPPGSNLGCNPTGVPAAGAATATDDCGTPAITSALGTVVVNGCQRTQTRTYTATDACGNTATCAQVFTWTVDVTGPTFTFCPAGVNLGCNPNGVPAPVVVTATDVCGGNVTITNALGNITTNGCNRSQTRTYTATDACGNTSTCIQVFTWTMDNGAPTFTFCPPGGNLGCNPTGVPAPGAATATDDCGAPTITSALGAITSDGCLRSQTRTYTATDVCGNTATCTQVFTWTLDVTPPTFTFCPPGSNLGCNPTGVPAPGAATATDACGAPTITSALGTVVINGCSRSQTRTYTARDACGNTTTCTQVFTWTVDVTGPTFTFCPPGANLGCNPNGVPAPGAATATDACGAVTITSALGTITNNGCNRSQTRTYTATDVCGNTSTCTQVFTWTEDLMAPMITCPTVNGAATCPGAAPTFGNATATDNCDQMVAITSTDAVTGMGCNVSTTRTWVATDDCGNTSNCSRTITVRDVTPPQLVNCPANRTVSCVNPPAVPAFGPAPTATDNCDQNVTVTFADAPVAGTACGRIFMRTWTARDDCGNTATCSQTITETPMVQFFQNGVPISDGNTINISFTPVLNISQQDPCCVGDFFNSINITVSVCGGAPISLGANNAQVCLSRNGNSANYKLDGLVITFRACATVYTLNGTRTNGVIQGMNCTVKNNVVCPPGQGFYDANGVPICGTNNCTYCSPIPPVPPIAPQSNLDIATPQWKDATHQHVSKEMTLSAFPNPTTGDINFSITTPTKGNLRLKLFDASGKQIGLIQRDDLEAGFENQIKYNIPAAVPSGLIFYTVTVGEEVKSGKLMYMKN